MPFPQVLQAVLRPSGREGTEEQVTSKEALFPSLCLRLGWKKREQKHARLECEPKGIAEQVLFFLFFLRVSVVLGEQKGFSFLWCGCW